MNPKEKADSLIGVFLSYTNPYEREPGGYGLLQYSTKVNIENAKQCAIICVDEILKSFLNNEWYNNDIQYWQSVKKEFESM